MNLYDTLTGYNIAAAKSEFESLSLYPSVTREPYMLFSSTVTLSGNIVASMLLSKHNNHVHFFDIWSNQLIQVIFDSEDVKLSLFDPNNLLEKNSGLLEFTGIDDVSDEVLQSVNLTRENLIELERISNELVEMFKKNETIGKYLV